MDREGFTNLVITWLEAAPDEEQNDICKAILEVGDCLEPRAIDLATSMAED